MLAQEELARLNVNSDTAVSLGVFDGVHQGHQHLISRLVEHARRHGLAGVVLVLHPHPRLVLNTQAPISYLTNLEERLALLRSLEVDHVGVVTFTSELSLLSPRQFVSLLCQGLRMRALVVGPDFALGHGRQGNAQVLTELGGEMGFSVEVVPSVAVDEQRVSSSAIRAALADGDVATVATMLGRPFSLSGPVVRGAERGATIGFPTANIAVAADRALPALGVYVTRAYLGDACYRSVTNIGRRPTFDASGITVETHILDYHGDIYGHELRIELLQKLRPEMRFAGVDELRQQIAKDIAAARAALS